MDILEKIKSHIQTHDNPLIVILGPTASGKTDLSLEIAKAIHGEIISTDSRQIYLHMDISTDLIQPEDQKGIPHHLVGIRNPEETLTMAEYRDLALEKITEIQARGHIPMLVGGTGLYISAIIDNYELKRIPPNEQLRVELEEEAQTHGKDFVHKRLAKLDPKAAEKIHPSNLRFVIRAIEKALHKDHKPVAPIQKFNPFLVGIEWPRDQLYARINQRVDRQLQRGLVQEVKQLLAKGYNENLPSMSSLGVKEIIPYIKGEQTLEQASEILKQNTRRYAKRQLTWFRRYKNIHWLTPPHA